MTAKNLQILVKGRKQEAQGKNEVDTTASIKQVFKEQVQFYRSDSLHLQLVANGWIQEATDERNKQEDKSKSGDTLICVKKGNRLLPPLMFPLHLRLTTDFMFLPRPELWCATPIAPRKIKPVSFNWLVPKPKTLCLMI